MDLSFSAEKFLKRLIEPQVLTILKEFQKHEISQNGNIAAIIVGGAAIEKWLNSSDDKIYTNDYDIRLVYKTEMYDENWQLYDEDNELLHDVADQLQNVLILRLNTYIHNNIDGITNSFYQKFQVKLIIENKELFFQDTYSNLRCISWEYQIEENIKRVSIIDIFPITNEVQEQYWQMSVFQEDESLKDIESEYPLPITKYYDINYVGLGYAIWDLINLISFKIKGIEQTDRNVIKLKTMIKILNNPKNNFNYKMMYNALEACIPKTQSFCVQNGIELDINKIMELGIQYGYFPNSFEQLDIIIREMGTKYICEFVDKLTI